jgi:(3,5-dihydroxyphenyl)acetyl-CoA 1,2-dioxygenase
VSSDSTLALDADLASLRDLRERLDRLPPRPRRSDVEQAEAERLLAEGRRQREELGARYAEAIYDELTDGRSRALRVAELVYAAAERYPGLVPTRAQVDAEREHVQKDKDGVEIEQGIFLAHVLAAPGSGLHLLHSMSQPRPEALQRADELARTGAVDLGPIRLDRRDSIGLVTIQNHRFLNAEDDGSTAALETAIDLVLADERIRVGVLRGGPAEHPKYAGRRILGAGINLTQLYHGQISFVEFMIERELGAVSKMYRGRPGGAFTLGEREDRLEKPWIACVEAFAIGGACQLLLVMDRVIAETGSYFNLPARKEGIVPGCANLRLPRMTGERIARQAIFFGRDFWADTPEGLLIADEVVAPEEMEAAAERAATQLLSSGATSLVANRRQLRIGQEPLDVFRRYMAGYAREQAYCLYSPALIDNLERNWDAAQRRTG